MGKISSEILNVIKEAIKLEINGRIFYEHSAEVTENKLGKKMFQKLAQDEIGHIDTFGQIFSSIVGSEEWKKYISEEETKDKSSIIEDLKSKFKKGKEEKSGELGAIRIGMELERKSIKFYEKSANETNDQKAKEIFRKITDEEKLHYDLLQAQYDYITKSGFWFDVAEFRMDGKY